MEQALGVIAFDDVVTAASSDGGDEAGVAVFQQAGGVGDGVDLFDPLAGVVGGEVGFVKDGMMAARFEDAKPVAVAQRFPEDRRK